MRKTCKIINRSEACGVTRHCKSSFSRGRNAAKRPREPFELVESQQETFAQMYFYLRRERRSFK